MTNLISIKETIKALLDTLHFSTLLPAILLVSFNIYFILPEFLPKIRWDLSNPDVLTWVIISLLIISYLLYAFNIILIKILEGYFWENTPLKKHKEQKKQKYRDLYKKNSENIDVDITFPKDEDFILPTRFGNVIAAAEYYSYDRYKIDAVTNWPRLMPILIKDKYSEFVSQQKGILDTMLNLMYIVFVCGIEFWLVSFYKGNFILALICPFVLFIIVTALYWGCINAAISWGQSIRVVFDMFKNKLHKELNLKPKKSYDGEIQQWNDLNFFFKTGNLMKIEDLNELFKY